MIDLESNLTYSPSKEKKKIKSKTEKIIKDSLKMMEVSIS